MMGRMLDIGSGLGRQYRHASYFTQRRFRLQRRHETYGATRSDVPKSASSTRARRLLLTGTSACAPEAAF